MVLKVWIMKTFPMDLKIFQIIQMKWAFIHQWKEIGVEVDPSEVDLEEDHHKEMVTLAVILTEVAPVDLVVQVVQVDTEDFLLWDQEAQWVPFLLEDSPQ